MKKAITIVFILCLFSTGCIFSGCGVNLKNLTGDNIVKAKTCNLKVQGSIEKSDVNINSKLAGKVIQINVKEGDSVKNGQVLALLDSSSLIAKKSQTQAQIDAAQGQVNAAQAAKQVAQAQLQKADDGARPEEITQAKAAYDLALDSYNRTKALYDAQAVPETQIEQVQTQLQVATAQYQLAKNGARPEDKSAAQAQVSQADAMIQAAKGQLLQAQGGLQEVQSYIDDSIIRAPSDGVVTEVDVKTGELVSTGLPIMVMSNAQSPTIDVDVKETDLSMIKLEQQVSVNLPAYKNKTFKGKVIKINEEPDFAVKRATNDNGEYDVMSYEVKVELENFNETLHPGMTAIVDFLKNGGK